MTTRLKRRVKNLTPRERATAKIVKVPRDPGIWTTPEPKAIFVLFSSKYLPSLDLSDVLREIKPWPWCTAVEMVDLALADRFCGRSFRLEYEPDPEPDAL